MPAATRYHPLQVAPSKLKAPINPFTPRALSARGVERQISAVRARRAARARSRLRRRRGDGLGGLPASTSSPSRAPTSATTPGAATPRKRMRFAVEIVRRVREACGPDFIIIYRLSMLDLVDGGWRLGRGRAAGAGDRSRRRDASSTPASAGTRRASRPSPPRCRAPRSPASPRSCSPHVRLPLVTTNRINMPDVAEAHARRGRRRHGVDGAPAARRSAMGRTRRAPARADEINTCIACNQACLDHVFENKRASCLVNPRACAETELDYLPTQRRRSRIAVVGAGPAGLACATVAAERGHRVDAVRRRRRDRRPVQPRQAHSRQGRVPRDAALLPASHRGNRRRRCIFGRVSKPTTLNGLRRGRARHRRDPARRSSFPGADHAKVVGYLGRARRPRRMRPARRDHRRRRHRLRRRRVPGARRSVADRWIRSAGCTNGASTRRSKRAAASRPRSPNRRRARSGCCSAAPGRPGARLGKTTGWIHRATLKAKGVQMLGGVEYLGRRRRRPAHPHRRRRTPAAGRPRRDLRRPGTASHAVRCAVGRHGAACT